MSFLETQNNDNDKNNNETVTKGPPDSQAEFLTLDVQDNTG